MIVVATKNGRTTKCFTLLFWCCCWIRYPRSGIRWIKIRFGDPGLTSQTRNSDCLHEAFLGPKLHSPIGSFHRGPQNSRFPAPTLPPPFPTKCICPHKKPYAQGRINHRCINNFINRIMYFVPYLLFHCRLEWQNIGNDYVWRIR
jgi:hypothetical protein